MRSRSGNGSDPIFIKSLHYRLVLLVITTCCLCQCTTMVNSSEPLPSVVKTEIPVKKKIASPYKLSAAAYIAKAKLAEGQDKQQFLLLAAGRLISEHRWRQGQAILSQTAALSFKQQDEKRLLDAKIYTLKNKPQEAIREIAGIQAIESLSVYYQTMLHELLAQSYASTANPLASAQERIQLESLLPDESSQKKNRHALWLTLINIPSTELDWMAQQAPAQSELKGWLQLAFISQQYKTNSQSLLAALDQWQTKHQTHPANTFLPAPLDSITHKMVQPKHVALLLPVSGPLAGPGKAIEKGFMTAYTEQNNTQSFQVKTYDTSTGDIISIYQQAINDGANYVVGPLTKAQVSTIAQIAHPVPTLLLNETQTPLQENAYSLGLSPTYEAKQVAIKASQKGLHKALIIAPSNRWGQEIVQAFSHSWSHQKGIVVDTLSYNDNDDLNVKMLDFLRINESQRREKQIKDVLGYNVQINANRRQDFDMIFLLAYPSKARQIMPLLKYYYAGNVPVFSTSMAYSGQADALKDKDLDGLIFCDIPWVFAHQMGNKNWPEQFNSYNRLYALGVESYALATQLNQLILFPADNSQEKNTLSLNASQHIARVLEWGQFKQGLPHSLGTIA